MVADGGLWVIIMGYYVTILGIMDDHPGGNAEVSRGWWVIILGMIA